MTQLSQLLARFRVEKGFEFTHTSLGRPGGSYYIPGSSYDAFVAAYKAAVAAGEHVHLTERHRHVGPGVCDLDFRFAPDAGDEATGAGAPRRRHTRRTVARVVEVLCRATARLLEVDDLECYVTEKPAATAFKGLVKDGLHLSFPQAVTRPEVHHLVRQDALPALREVLAEELPDLVNCAEDVLDEAVVERNNWMMYGSRKPGGEPYAVTARYRYRAGDDALQELPLPEAADVDYVSLLSIRNKYDEVPVRAAAAERVDAFVARTLEEKRRREVVASVMASSPNPSANTCEDLDMVVKMVRVLDPRRMDNYNDWARLGWCLRNIDHRLLDTWIEASRQSPKYVEGECPRLWNAMRAGGLGIGTLHMWARQDAPERYRELLREGLSGLIRGSIESSTHYDVALVVHHLYRYQYVCCNIRNRTWYEFRDHRWRECESGYTLRARLSTDVFREYGAAHAALERQLEQLHARVRSGREAAFGLDDDDSPSTLAADPLREQRQADERAYMDLKKRIKRAHDLALKLKVSSFKDNVLKECCELFYHDKFENKLDANLDLLGFENGVLDLSRAEFREGRPDDYVSFTTGINHVPYNPEHPAVAELNRYWESVHPDADVRDYVLTCLASCLSGRIREERFNIWTGSGSNSKSLSVTLIEKTLGEYCCKFPVTLLTQKRGASSSATPEIARAKGRRFAVLQEPSEDERLNVGQLKELSGGDVIQTRELFKAPVEWKPQFKLFLLCNHLPTVPSDDGGTWRRIRVVEFGSKFTDNPNPDNPREFPIDLDLPKRLDAWKEHFMAMLIERYKRYVTSALREPEAVMACTREYQRTNDHLADFVDTCVERSADPADCAMSLEDAFAEYKEWSRSENVPVLQQRIKKAALGKYLERVLGKPSGGGGVGKAGSVWRGVRILDRYGGAAAAAAGPEDTELP